MIEKAQGRADESRLVHRADEGASVSTKIEHVGMRARRLQ